MTTSRYESVTKKRTAITAKVTGNNNANAATPTAGTSWVKISSVP